MIVMNITKISKKNMILLLILIKEILKKTYE